MLKKLIKYEWKAVWRALAIINAFTVAATLLGMFAMNILSTPNNTLQEEDAVFFVLLFLFYYATIMGVSFAMTIYIAVRFYRNLYTDEGYLMHTLPVTKRQLVISKLLVHFVCMCITGLLVGTSICMLLLPLLSEITGDPSVSIAYFMESLSRECSEVFGTSLPVFLLLSLIAVTISQLSGILSIYCAISLGQTFGKHKIMGSILCYIGIYFLTQTLSTVAMMPQIMLTITETDFSMASYLNNTLLTVSVISLFTGIAFYMITLYMTDKKLNLD